MPYEVTAALSMLLEKFRNSEDPITLMSKGVAGSENQKFETSD